MRIDKVRTVKMKFPLISSKPCIKYFDIKLANIISAGRRE